jgi:heme iron utilization protein
MIVSVTGDVQEQKPPEHLPKAEETLVVRARRLAERCTVGMLSTQLERFPGFPFGSMVLYATDAHGRPVFHLSRLAVHTQNLHKNWHASLLIADVETGLHGNALPGARLTLLGTMEQISIEFGSAIYLPKHESARGRLNFTDFSFYQLQVSHAYFVGGFGQMAWIPVEEYFSCRIR